MRFSVLSWKKHSSLCKWGFSLLKTNVSSYREFVLDKVFTNCKKYRISKWELNRNCPTPTRFLRNFLGTFLGFIYQLSLSADWFSVKAKSWPLKDPHSWIWLDGFVGLLFEMQKQTGRDENQTEPDSHARFFQINPLKRNNPHFLEVRESTKPQSQDNHYCRQIMTYWTSSCLSILLCTKLVAI